MKNTELEAIPKRKRVLKRVLVGILVVLALFAVMFSLYMGDYSHASPTALESAQSDSHVTVQQLDGAIAFVPQDPVAGFIFYPGAKVESKAYAPLMRACADRGILAVVVEPPFNFALLDSDAAARVPAQFPQVRSWMVGGHSLGGVAASSCLANNPDIFSALVLLASFSSTDLSSYGGKVVSIRASNDLVLNMSEYEKAQANLPPDSVEIVIEGGNHAGFGDYGTQRGDGEADISGIEQQSATADAIAALATVE